MAASKVNREDAQEWLESLQQVGEGWYRQVALAVRAGAHKALGMERREFAQQIGQRMIDPREAIIELHNEGHSQAAIADILGVSSDRTVNRILAEEGLVEPQRHIAALAEGEPPQESALAEGDPVDSTAEDMDEEVKRLRGEVDRLSTEVKGEQAKRKREADKAREKLHKAQENLRDMKRKLEEAENAEPDPAERERLRKENEAWAAEERRKVLAGLAALGVQGVVGALEEAAEHLRALLDEGTLTGDLIRQVEEAHAAFTEELNVARATVGASVYEGR